MTEAAPTSTDATQVLAALLLPERDKYNARFALAQSRSRALQPREWKAVLNEDVAPLVFAAQQARADSAPLVAEAAYDEALRLLARNILGPRSNQSASALWRGVLAPCARAVAESPRRVLTRASNALAELRAHHLDGQWTQRAGELASRGLLAKLSAQDLERALFVLAWRCGLAHARGAALESLRALPFELASAIFGVENVSETEWATLRERMEREPFFDPSRGATGEERLEIVAQVGDWDAWGGAMAQPPRVARRKGALWAWSGRAWWRLHADAFGATLSPARFSITLDQIGDDESCGAWKVQVHKLQAPSAKAEPGALESATHALQVTHGPNGAYSEAEAALLRGFDGVLSAASDDHALAFTSRLSMRVFVVARVPEHAAST